MVWALVAKRRWWLGEEMHGVWSRGLRPRGIPASTWREVVEKDCQARKLNKEDRRRKLIKDVWWTGWVCVGECFFWYRPTRVVPDKGPLNGCVCVIYFFTILYAWQALGLRRDDTFSTTMLNNSVEQLVSEMDPCPGCLLSACFCCTHPLANNKNYACLRFHKVVSAHYQSVCGMFALLDIILLPCLALHACYSDSKIMTAHNSYWCYCEVAVTVWGKTWTAGCVCVVVSGKASIFYTDVQPVSSLLRT